MNEIKHRDNGSVNVHLFTHFCQTKTGRFEFASVRTEPKSEYGMTNKPGRF